MTEVVGTVAGNFVEVDRSELGKRTAIDYCKDLRFCINDGGGFSSGDAFDTFLYKAYGTSVPQDETLPVRASLEYLEQDIKAADIYKFRQQRLGAYRELFIFGVTAPAMREDFREKLTLMAAGEMGTLLSRIQDPELTQNYRNLVRSYKEADESRWLTLTLKHVSFFNPQEQDDAKETSANALQTKGQYREGDRLTPLPPEKISPFSVLMKAVRSNRGR